VLPFGVLFLDRRNTDHTADLSFTSCIGHEDANERFCIEPIAQPIALRPPRTSADMSAGRINDVIADAVLHQQAMKPKAIAASTVSGGSAR
jgi:hypothetical protein